MQDILYIIGVFLGWSIVAAILAAIVVGIAPGPDALIFFVLWFGLIITGWLVTMPRQR